MRWDIGAIFILAVVDDAGFRVEVHATDGGALLHRFDIEDTAGIDRAMGVIQGFVRDFGGAAAEAASAEPVATVPKPEVERALRIVSSKRNDALGTTTFTMSDGTFVDVKPVVDEGVVSYTAEYGVGGNVYSVKATSEGFAVEKALRKAGVTVEGKAPPKLTAKQRNAAIGMIGGNIEGLTDEALQGYASKSNHRLHESLRDEVAEIASAEIARRASLSPEPSTVDEDDFGGGIDEDDFGGAAEPEPSTPVQAPSVPLPMSADMMRAVTLPPRDPPTPEREGDEDFSTVTRDGALVSVPVWSDDRTSRNWLARIGIDSSAPGGLSRVFLDKYRKPKGTPRSASKLYYVDNKQAMPVGSAVEFAADSGDWNLGTKKTRRWYGVLVRRTGVQLAFKHFGSDKAAATRAVEFAKSMSNPSSGKGDVKAVAASAAPRYKALKTYRDDEAGPCVRWLLVELGDMPLSTAATMLWELSVETMPKRGYVATIYVRADDGQTVEQIGSQLFVGSQLPATISGGKLTLTLTDGIVSAQLLCPSEQEGGTEWFGAFGVLRALTTYPVHGKAKSATVDITCKYGEEERIASDIAGTFKTIHADSAEVEIVNNVIRKTGGEDDVTSSFVLSLAGLDRGAVRVFVVGSSKSDIQPMSPALFAFSRHVGGRHGQDSDVYRTPDGKTVQTLTLKRMAKGSRFSLSQARDSLIPEVKAAAEAAGRSLVMVGGTFDPADQRDFLQTQRVIALINGNLRWTGELFYPRAFKVSRSDDPRAEEYEGAAVEPESPVVEQEAASDDFGGAAGEDDSDDFGGAVEAAKMEPTGGDASSFGSVELAPHGAFAGTFGDASVRVRWPGTVEVRVNGLAASSHEVTAYLDKLRKRLVAGVMDAVDAMRKDRLEGRGHSVKDYPFFEVDDIETNIRPCQLSVFGGPCEMGLDFYPTFGGVRIADRPEVALPGGDDGPFEGEEGRNLGNLLLAIGEFSLQWLQSSNAVKSIHVRGIVDDYNDPRAFGIVSDVETKRLGFAPREEAHPAAVVDNRGHWWGNDDEDAKVPYFTAYSRVMIVAKGDTALGAGYFGTGLLLEPSASLVHGDGLHSHALIRVDSVTAFRPGMPVDGEAVPRITSEGLTTLSEQEGWSYDDEAYPLGADVFTVSSKGFAIHAIGKKSLKFDGRSFYSVSGERPKARVELKGSGFVVEATAGYFDGKATAYGAGDTSALVDGKVVHGLISSAQVLSYIVTPPKESKEELLSSYVDFRGELRIRLASLSDGGIPGEYLTDEVRRGLFDAFDVEGIMPPEDHDYDASRDAEKASAGSPSAKSMADALSAKIEAAKAGALKAASAPQAKSSEPLEVYEDGTILELRSGRRSVWWELYRGPDREAYEPNNPEVSGPIADAKDEVRRRADEARKIGDYNKAREELSRTIYDDFRVLGNDEVDAPRPEKERSDFARTYSAFAGWDKKEPKPEAAPKSSGSKLADRFKAGLKSLQEKK